MEIAEAFSASNLERTAAGKNERVLYLPAEEADAITIFYTAAQQ